jgi:hypothetical protein
MQHDRMGDTFEAGDEFQPFAGFRENPEFVLDQDEVGIPRTQTLKQGCRGASASPTIIYLNVFIDCNPFVVLSEDFYIRD